MDVAVVLVVHVVEHHVLGVVQPEISKIHITLVDGEDVLCTTPHSVPVLICMFGQPPQQLLSRAVDTVHDHQEPPSGVRRGDIPASLTTWYNDSLENTACCCLL